MTVDEWIDENGPFDPPLSAGEKGRVRDYIERGKNLFLRWTVIDIGTICIDVGGTAEDVTITRPSSAPEARKPK